MKQPREVLPARQMLGRPLKQR